MASEDSGFSAPGGRWEAVPALLAVALTALAVRVCPEPAEVTREVAHHAGQVVSVVARVVGPARVPVSQVARPGADHSDLVASVAPAVGEEAVAVPALWR